MTAHEELNMTDYFADRLIAQLDAADQAVAAYEAQDESRKVGFDFKDFSDVVPRALDEVRETREAREEAQDAEQAQGREHYGDEIADLMFSAVNLARLGGIEQSDLIPFAELAAREETNHTSGDSAEALTSVVEASINHLAESFSRGGSDFIKELEAGYEVQMTAAIRLARLEGYDPTIIFHDNVYKYLTRCGTIEALAKRDGKQWADLFDAGEIITYWKKAKAVERGQATLETA